jgi:hypothetical protein
MFNGLVLDDFEFDAAGPPPICTRDLNLTVALSAPLNSTVQINEFLLQGMVQTTTSLDQATLTVTIPGSTKVTNLLSTSMQPAGVSQFFNRNPGSVNSAVSDRSPALEPASTA